MGKTKHNISITLPKTIETVINDVGAVLDNAEAKWMVRYSEFKRKIELNYEKIEKGRNHFAVPPSFDVFIMIGEIIGTAQNASRTSKYEMRQLGRKIADISVDNSKVARRLANKRWNSWINTDLSENGENRPSEKDIAKRKEARIQTLLLRKFSKEKCYNIDPVQFCDCFFPFTTAVDASRLKNNEMSLHINDNGGGIDILARSGKDKVLTVIEVKDEYKSDESPKVALEQAAAYAVFLQRLLRSSDGQFWWSLFGMPDSLPDSLTIRIVSAMPYKKGTAKGEEYSGSNRVVFIDEKDCLEQHNMFFCDNGKDLDILFSTLD